jgi:hypothetical protein
MFGGGAMEESFIIYAHALSSFVSEMIRQINRSLVMLSENILENSV